MKTNYTNTQLKQALAKMLPETCIYDSESLFIWDKDFNAHRMARDTELLHLCWLVEETLKDSQLTTYAAILCKMIREQWELQIIDETIPDGFFYHATWQQRTIALCKVKGVEI